MNHGPAREESWSVYFAGELFSFKHLVGNAALADAIHSVGNGRYRCILPQTLEQRGTTPLSIRNQDLKVVLSCDLGIFHFDGPELDSGTVVEFMAAKFLDIPAIIIRSDFRRSGDGDEPWNLMASGFPRTKTILVDCISEVHRALASIPHDSADPIGCAKASVEGNLKAFQRIAAEVVQGFDEVRAMAPRYSREASERMYEMFPAAVGGEFDQLLSPAELVGIARDKASRGLL